MAKPKTDVAIDLVNMDFVSQVNVPDRSMSARARARREEMSAQRIAARHAAESEHREPDTVIPRGSFTQNDIDATVDEFAETPTQDVPTVTCHTPDDDEPAVITLPYMDEFPVSRATMEASGVIATAIPESRQTIQAAIPPIPELAPAEDAVAREFDNAEATAEVSRCDLILEGVVPATSMDEAYQALTGDPDAHAIVPNKTIMQLLDLAKRPPPEPCTCDGFMTALTAQTITVADSGAIVVKESDDRPIEELVHELDNPKNPMRCCLECGGLMDSSVPIQPFDEATLTDENGLCCGGMQRAINDGRVEIPGLQQIYNERQYSKIGKLWSLDSPQPHRFHTCPWCGTMIAIALQKLQAARFDHRLYSTSLPLSKIDKGWVL